MDESAVRHPKAKDTAPIFFTREGKSYFEIAQILGLNESMVRDFFNRTKFKNRNYSAAEDLMKTSALYNHYKEAVICQDTEERAH